MDLKKHVLSFLENDLNNKSQISMETWLNYYQPTMLYLSYYLRLTTYDYL
jgi:hypothetical protein